MAHATKQRAILPSQKFCSAILLGWTVSSWQQTSSDAMLNRHWLTVMLQHWCAHTLYRKSEMLISMRNLYAAEHTLGSMGTPIWQAPSESVGYRSIPLAASVRSVERLFSQVLQPLILSTSEPISSD
eukprot:5333570-Amphidinium_carterae.1